MNADGLLTFRVRVARGMVKPSGSAGSPAASLSSPSSASSSASESESASEYAPQRTRALAQPRSTALAVPRTTEAMAATTVVAVRVLPCVLVLSAPTQRERNTDLPGTASVLTQQSSTHGSATGFVGHREGRLGNMSGLSPVCVMGGAGRLGQAGFVQVALMLLVPATWSQPDLKMTRVNITGVIGKIRNA